MKILGIPQSGKIGPMVSYKHNGVQCQREYILPHDPRSALQLARREALERAARLWHTLSPEQYFHWRLAADGLRTHRTLNQSGALAPYNLFSKLNCNLAIIGLPMVVEPPALPCFEDNPVAQFTITNTNGDLALQVAVRGQPTQSIVVWAAQARNPGTNYVDHFTILGVLPAPVLGMSDITALYLAQWGWPPVGSRIFIETVQQCDGWQTLPHRLTALVPASVAP